MSHDHAICVEMAPSGTETLLHLALTSPGPEQALDGGGQNQSDRLPTSPSPSTNNSPRVAHTDRGYTFRYDSPKVILCDVAV